MNIIISIVFILVGVMLIGYFYPKTKKRIGEITNTETTKISELKEMLSVETTKYVELKGKASNKNSIEAPYSKKQVAYYEYYVYRKYSVRNDDGTTRKERDLISSEKSEQDVSFMDNSCEEAVLLEMSKGCEIDIPVTYNKFESSGGSMEILGIRFGDNPDTIGHEIQEKAIEVNQDLYVIGEAYKEGEKIHIRKPQDNKKPFIVTTKSEEELIKYSKRTSIIQLVVGIVSIIGGIIVFVI